MFDPNNVLASVVPVEPLGFPGAVDTGADDYDGPAVDDEETQNALQGDLEAFEEPIEPLQ